MDDSVLDATFSALGDKTRRAILTRLMQGSSTVTVLAQPYDMSLNAVSKHIKMLENAGLVKRNIKGRVHTISLADSQLHKIQNWLTQFGAEPEKPVVKTKPLVNTQNAATVPKPESSIVSEKPSADAHHSGRLLDKLASRLTKLGRS